ncbi:hypothetical protein [Adhaeribacter pallidiroseus]|uniref:Secreted protein n=1 Tax=Adhaeribacter pallidiroseus TaxID=2072847 RepID=A0A369QIY5_9BACT|nr:hypothetical protein [Adhaeribacter pallidiroseus]RDC63555.1 hypothetical protein AHMF7616_02160 [Adhaeribacter pallidiroseus]
MKTLCLLVFLVWSSTLVHAQGFLSESSKQIFTSPQLPKQIRTHQTVAILPVEAKITYAKLPKNFNAKVHQEQEARLGQNIQKSLYTYFARRVKSYSVTFQDVDKTNALLEQAGMYGNLKNFTPDQMAQALGVDAVLNGKFDLEQTQADGSAFVTAVMRRDYVGKTGLGSLTLMLYHGQNGELLWRFFKIVDDDFTAANKELVERLMRKVSRNLPYSI